MLQSRLPSSPQAQTDLYTTDADHANAMRVDWKAHRSRIPNVVRHDQCSPCRKISNHDPLRARLGTTLGPLVGLRMLLPRRFSGRPHRTLSLLPELFATHQVCDEIISSCDDASKTSKVDSKGGNEAGKGKHISLVVELSDCDSCRSSVTTYHICCTARDAMCVPMTLFKPSSTFAFSEHSFPRLKRN